MTRPNLDRTGCLATRILYSQLLKITHRAFGSVERPDRSSSLNTASIVFGKRHLDHLVTEFVEYYNTARSSMARGNRPPDQTEEPDEVPTLSLDELTVRSYVGGLVKGFERRAA